MNLSRRNNIFYIFDPVSALECQIIFAFLRSFPMWINLNNFHNTVKSSYCYKSNKNCLPIARFSVIFSAYLSGQTSFRRKIIFTWNKQNKSINTANYDYFLEKREKCKILKRRWIISNFCEMEIISIRQFSFFLWWKFYCCTKNRFNRILNILMLFFSLFSLTGWIHFN